MRRSGRRVCTARRAAWVAGGGAASRREGACGGGGWHGFARRARSWGKFEFTVGLWSPFSTAHPKPLSSACHHWGAASKVAPTPVTPLLTGSLARARKFSVDAGLRRAPSTRIRPARLLWSVREGFWLCERGRHAMQLSWKNALISVGVRRPRCQERR
jgi:hypothetical protein